MGTAESAIVGDSLGCVEGRFVLGTAVGRVLGASVGSRVGMTVAAALGARVGLTVPVNVGLGVLVGPLVLGVLVGRADPDGAEVGLLLGCAEGVLVGSCEGLRDGAVDGLLLGAWLVVSVLESTMVTDVLGELITSTDALMGTLSA